MPSHVIEPAAGPGRRPAAALTAAVAAGVAVLLLAALSVVAMSSPARAETTPGEVTGFGSNPGNLRMFRYAPPGLTDGRPVVVALHGCTQNASGYAAATGWMRLADTYKFTVVFPQQQTANNMNACFNWFESGDTRRDSGEALSIKQMVERTKRDHGSTSAYVSGLSAGGGMTSAMLAAYPDVFSGGGVIAGLPHGCANSVAAALSCMSPGVNKSPKEWGDKVRAAFPAYAGPRPKVSIWHGTTDSTVRPMNATELMEQFTDANGTDQTPDTTDTVGGYPHRVYGSTVETYQITGMGHGQPVDPGTGPAQCGTAAAYVLDVNICSAYHLVRFWGIDDSASPTPTPTPSPTPTAPPYSDTAIGTATDHYVAQRVTVTEYNRLGAAHGYTTPFTLYRCETGWTDKADYSPI
ncbi:MULTISPECIES: extracellular catalytic domain type 1 short-chain-length polyhydroxyalkanoate depolymerase [Streptomyces]|uniref:extracellular catalytic domain type 1 short-chain-length polyhydroxyalkanoate depolymerase n=1 Tax=Streptomyces TaxID=1883 RepID=UPI001E435C06|nr:MULTISPECIES: PHB depolymerase family esterase [Streptomyces]UFQ19497.1 PHB depolymerase family esterase [Streptomyces huasconensis]WCL89116.1 PHB depolymerase family esterase [Streptomyces sp. JCM 35825]